MRIYSPKILILLPLGLIAWLFFSARPFHTRRSGATVSSKKPRFIETIYWMTNSTGHAPDVLGDLTKADGMRIRIVTKVTHDTAPILVDASNSNAVFIKITDRNKLSHPPSSLSLVLLTGILRRNDGVFELYDTSYQWIDR